MTGLFRLRSRAYFSQVHFTFLKLKASLFWSAAAHRQFDVSRLLRLSSVSSGLVPCSMSTLRLLCCVVAARLLCGRLVTVDCAKLPAS